MALARCAAWRRSFPPSGLTCLPLRLGSSASSPTTAPPRRTSTRSTCATASKVPGTYHFPVLLAWSGIPSVVNPLLAGPTRRKTDVLDARLLAHHSITGMWKPSFVPSAQAQELRVVWATRAEALRRATRASNQINNIVLRFGHTFGRDCSMRSAQGEGIISDLLDGRIPRIPTVNPDGLPLSVRPRIRDLANDLHTNMQRTKRAGIEAMNFVQSRDWPLGKGTLPGVQLMGILQSVPGVGQTTALTWLSEVCDPSRFQVDKQVAAFSGCDPSLKVSAGKVTSMVRRAGNARLHAALLYAAAGVLRQPADPLGQWGRSIAGRHKKGGHRKACGAIARRLAVSLWHVHRKGEMYDGSQYQLVNQFTVPDVKLSSILPKRAVSILKAEHVTSTAALALAYTEGKLAGMFGLGSGTIAKIKAWISEHGTRKHFAHRKSPLALAVDRDAKGNFKFPKRVPIKTGAPDAEPLAAHAAALPISSSQSQTLNPSLTSRRSSATPRTAKLTPDAVHRN